MEYTRPLVTIGLPFYNAELTLARSIESIISQTYMKWELLLLDDGSDDASFAIAESFNDKRIVIISGNQNRGISARLNQAINLARGQYFCRMDADDVAFPGRLEKQVAFLESHPDVDLVASSVVVFRNDGSLSGVIQIPRSHQEICLHPWRGFTFPHPTWLGKLVWFKGHSYSTEADGTEDQFLLYSAYRKSHLASIPDILLGYREDRRSFRKMLSKRMIWWRAIARSSIKDSHFRDLLLISLATPMKIVADFLNTVMGITSARNKLDTVSPAVAEVWRLIWKEVKRPDKKHVDIER